MRQTTSLLFVALTVLLSSAIAAQAAKTGPSASTARPEIRALWVDGFNPGIRTREEAGQLIADAKRAGINTLFVQVRRRGDSLYRQSIEPPVEDFVIAADFDPLKNIIEAAHKEGITVHAWMNVMTVWKKQAPPSAADHIFNLHGPMAAEGDNWLTASPTGSTVFPVGYFLDPGHPGAADHLVRTYANLARKYDVDGIHLDYIRYPETEEKLPAGSGVGYNPVSIERFRRFTGRSDTPAPGDVQWMEWRRQQVSQLVRRIYLEVKAVNPRIEVSAATIAWGQPPVKSFATSAPMQLVYQDWNGWLKAGFLDMAVPMNYSRESDPKTSAYFTGWIGWEKKHKFGRQLVVGVGSYLNSADGTLSQIQRVRKPEGRNTADGMSFFSYASLVRAGERPNTTALSALYTGSAAPFSVTVPPGTPAWLQQPDYGWLAGVARDRDGKPLDTVQVQVRRAGWFPFRRSTKVLTDGNGFFGLSGLKPGRYQIELQNRGARVKSSTEITAGKVQRLELRER